MKSTPAILAVFLAAACSAPETTSLEHGDRHDEGGANPTPAAAAATKPQDGSNPGSPNGRKGAVVFVHGTSDHGDLSGLQCSGTGDEWNCVSKTAAAEYWTQIMVDSQRVRADGTLRPYAVVGCPLSAQTPWPNPTPVKPEGGPAEPGSAACVGAEIAKFLDGPDGKAGTDDDIQDIAIITHSGGSNVVRYLLQQHSSQPSFERVHKATRGAIMLAAPSHGTYLADKVFRFGLLSIGNRLFAAGYDDDGVQFIQTEAMKAFNRDPAKLVNLSKDVAGVPAFMGSGSFPDKDGDSIQIGCGGEKETKGLNALHGLYLDANDPETFRDGCSDGFITCQSAMALAGGDESRVVFGVLGSKTIGRTHFRAHNQSRNACDGLDLDVRKKVNEILSGAAAKPALAGQLLLKRTLSAFAPMNRSIRTQYKNVALESNVAAVRPGERMHVRVDGADPASLRGFVRAPSGTIVDGVSFERDATGTLFASFALPSSAAAGSWSVHVATSAQELEAHEESIVPVAVSRSHGAIDNVTVSSTSSAITLRVVVRGEDRARLGLRATLVSEDSDGAHAVDDGQVSERADPSGLTVLSLTFKPSAGRLSVRDLALVSHDDASTLDVRERIEIP